MIEIIPNWHPLLVHFTIALLSVAVVGFLVAHLFQGWSRSGELMKVAEWNFWLGSLSALFTVVAGWYAFNTVNHDASSHAAMSLHRNWALVTVAIILLLDVWIWRIRKSDAARITHAFALALVAFILLLATTAWHGGELVYRYGLGVMSLPAREGDGDDHHHEHENSGALHRGTVNRGFDASHAMPEASHHEELYERGRQASDENIPANGGAAVGASADTKDGDIPSEALRSPGAGSHTHEGRDQHAH